MLSPLGCFSDHPETPGNPRNPPETPGFGTRKPRCASTLRSAAENAPVLLLPNRWATGSRFGRSRLGAVRVGRFLRRKLHSAIGNNITYPVAFPCTRCNTSCPLCPELEVMTRRSLPAPVGWVQHASSCPALSGLVPAWLPSLLPPARPTAAASSP